MHVNKALARQTGLLLRAIRLRAGLDQAQLAARIGISQPTVSRWEWGSGRPARGQAERWLEACAAAAEPAVLAQVRAVLLDVLEARGGAGQLERIRRVLTSVLNHAELVSSTAVPYYADVAAGIGEAQEQRSAPRSELSVPREVYERDPFCYAMRVSGDSMAPGLLDGDIVIVSPAAPLHDGCTVAAYVEPDGDVVKLYRRRPDGTVLLEPANPRFPTIVLPPGGERSARLWGRVVLAQREL